MMKSKTNEQNKSSSGAGPVSQRCRRYFFLAGARIAPPRSASYSGPAKQRQSRTPIRHNIMTIAVQSQLCCLNRYVMVFLSYYIRTSINVFRDLSSSVTIAPHVHQKATAVHDPVSGLPRLHGPLLKDTDHGRLGSTNQSGSFENTLTQ